MATLPPRPGPSAHRLYRCPRCHQRQAQSAGLHPRERAQAHPPATGSGRQHDLSSARPADMMHLPCGKEH
jgi:hypothetical protein